VCEKAILVGVQQYQDDHKTHQLNHPEPFQNLRSPLFPGAGLFREPEIPEKETLLEEGLKKHLLESQKSHGQDSSDDSRQKPTSRNTLLGT
jgi:hypothetical protein